jgi:rhodanese-related sulfurtransferase
MISRFSVPQVSVNEVAVKLNDNQPVLLLDVREPHEWQMAKIPDERILYVPMSKLVQNGTEVFPDQIKDTDRELIVFCHHGIRSAQVVTWMHKQGWKKVFSMTGGIDTYARIIDPSVGTY